MTGRHRKPKEPKLSFLTTAGGIFAGVAVIGALIFGGIVTGIIPSPHRDSPEVVQQAPKTNVPVVSGTVKATTPAQKSVQPTENKQVPTIQPNTPTPQRPIQTPVTPVVPPVVNVPDAQVDAGVAASGLVGVDAQVDTQKGLDVDLGIDVPLLDTIEDQVNQLPLLGK